MTAAHPALVLNADFQPVSYFPLSTTTWQEAIKAVVKGQVAVVAEYDDVVRSPSISMRIPSVIALRDYQPAPRHVAFTRFNVFLRDNFHCQYCGGAFAAKDLTFDHVIPRSKGGRTAWANIVAACDSCNLRKGNRTDLKPAIMPAEPSAWELQAKARRFPPKYLHESWADYLYWDTELEP